MATLVTSDYWDTKDKKKPIGDFDPDAELDFPFICNYWLDAEGVAIPLDDSRCSVNGFDAFDCEKRTVQQNIFLVRIKKKAGVELQKHKLYPVRLDFGIADGQHDQKTFWFRLKDH